MDVNPYVIFNGRCEEAVDFYRQALGAEVEMMMRFSDAPEGSCPPGMPDPVKSKIMHVSFKVGDTAILASDGMCTGDSTPKFEGFSLAINVPDTATAEKLFGALSAEGKVNQPLTETFFAPRFGVVADKFGLNWMIVARAPAT